MILGGSFSIPSVCLFVGVSWSERHFKNGSPHAFLTWEALLGMGYVLFI
jgi:hypothetical protein